MSDFGSQDGTSRPSLSDRQGSWSAGDDVSAPFPADPPPPPPPARGSGNPAVPPPTAAPRKSRAGMFFFGALGGCLLVVGFVFLVLLFAIIGDTEMAELTAAGEKVAVVPIEGEIVDSRETIDALHRYQENASIKAIVLRINSPGGAVAPSQEIYSAVLRIREGGKPIVASLDSVAASGGFYIASACDRIIANPGSITGSIGVILQWFDVKELMTWAKLKPETIKSGALKDAGSPFREMSPEERQYFQHIVDQLHRQFVRDVSVGRKLPYAEVAKIADGRVFTGEEAVTLKMVDELGTIDDAVRVAGKLGGIEGEPTRIWPRRRESGLLDLLQEGTAESIVNRIATRRIPQFLYHW